MSERAEIKVCRVCGRDIEWRKKWADDWAHVRYCSRGCRRTGVTPLDRKLEAGILRALRDRTGGLDADDVDGRFTDGSVDRKRVRNALRRLARAGRVELRSDGRRLDVSRARGNFEVVLRS